MAYFGLFSSSPNPQTTFFFFFAQKSFYCIWRQISSWIHRKVKLCRKSDFLDYENFWITFDATFFTMFVWCFDIISIHYSRNDFRRGIRKSDLDFQEMLKWKCVRSVEKLFFKNSHPTLLVTFIIAIIDRIRRNIQAKRPPKSFISHGIQLTIHSPFPFSHALCLH